ncbi:putative pentatricopeptide repeat-containing protein At5g37570 isoform X2 [Arachis ipaensis]|uniref:putative pentatricopeptide repeat-containing protein At5g37570 isoform X2 n=1 Tax=Arachis ipaensis TaxID=130454 RepID=UPI000A2B293A|nr:putative pentatricopeptide repeat-containing protein At5g37570 isoform X2 [Arachis ipaensis]XP_029149102.1 putative pentatricopeptide repeat-containing protein At5g37570 isoform X2 [Arachis hypogaea]
MIIIIYLCMKFYTGTASLHSQPPKASPLLTQFLNTSTTILHLKQTQAFALKLLSHQSHQYNHFLGRLFLRIFYLNAEISNLCYAHKLFDEMPNCPNTFLWTSLIRAFISGTQFRHGISTYARMHQNGVLPSEFTYSTVLNACGRIPATFEGTQVHARVVQSGFLGNKFVQTALLDMYAKFGSVFDARVVFDGMCDRDLVAWTAMICGYAKAGMMIHARWLFDNMGEKNSFTWTTMVAGYANSGDMKSAKKLYDAMDEENKSVVTWVAMIAGYGKFGNVSEAKRVFDRISTPRDPSACAAMLACYAQNGYAKEAIDMYKEMRQSKIKITEVAMVGALSACAQLRDIQMSSTLTEHVEESIYAFAEHGKSQDAIDLFLKMQKEGLQPNQVTFVGLLNACSSSALVDEGCRYFRTMTEVFGIQPLPEHYACMVDLLGRAGQLERAYCLIEQNASTDATTWGSLLAACRVYGNVELGETAARHLTMIDPEDSGNYVLLANTYASKDKWEHAEEVRKFMSEKRMKKPSGHSWLQREISGQFRDEIF